MTAADEYEKVWDLLARMHKETHGEEHTPPSGDFACCGEYAVLMALRAVSAVRPGEPAYLVSRIAAMPELDRDFYVKSVLATDGEPPPSEPEAMREYRASRRYHILWTELKEAAARIAELEKDVDRLRSDAHASVRPAEPT
ncbi:MAG TPA: hypothetical protein VJ326_02475 [Thermoplasmata archaeon]|nr:hypothetical protein [Thermoplasmata archaeon]